MAGELHRQAVRDEMDRARQEFRRLLDEATPAGLRGPTRGTRWTNEQLLFHVLFGYLITRALILLAKAFGLVGGRASKASRGSSTPRGRRSTWSTTPDPVPARG